MVVQVYCVVSGGIPILHRTSGEGNLVSNKIKSRVSIPISGVLMTSEL